MQDNRSGSTFEDDALLLHQKKLLSEIARAILDRLAQQSSSSDLTLGLLRVVKAIATRYPLQEVMGSQRTPAELIEWISGDKFSPAPSAFGSHWNDDDEDDSNNDKAAETPEMRREMQRVQDLDDLACEAVAYVSHPSPFVQHVALEIVQEVAMRVPAKKVLNLLHRLWPSICGRLEEVDGRKTNLGLHATMYKTIIVAMGVSGDFMAQRFRANAMPGILKFVTSFHNAAPADLASTSQRATLCMPLCSVSLPLRGYAPLCSCEAQTATLQRELCYH